MLHQDVLSYQRVIDSVDDKARTLVQSSSDPQLANFVSQTGSRYEKLCSNAKVCLFWEHVVCRIINILKKISVFAGCKDLMYGLS